MQKCMDPCKRYFRDATANFWDFEKFNLEKKQHTQQIMQIYTLDCIGMCKPENRTL